MVINIRKDGTKQKTMKGQKVKRSEVPELYEFLKRRAVSK